MSNPYVGQDAASPQVDFARVLAAAVYVLQVLGVTAILGVIINYVKMGEARGTWVESHFRWQIRTFWYSLLWCGLLASAMWALAESIYRPGGSEGNLGALVLPTLLGIAGGVVIMAWVLFRVLAGMLRLRKGQPI